MLSIFKLVFTFYRKFLWFSLLLNFLFIGFETPFTLALIYKILFAMGIFWLYRISGKGEKLIFYNNLQLGSIKLFILSFAFDAVLLISIYLIFGLLL